jgi:hypothetical protein
MFRPAVQGSDKHRRSPLGSPSLTDGHVLVWLFHVQRSSSAAQKEYACGDTVLSRVMAASAAEPSLGFTRQVSSQMYSQVEMKDKISTKLQRNNYVLLYE